MTDCSEVVVDIISGEELPLLAAGIGGTIAAFVGLAVGIIIMKCFCMDVLKQKFNSGQKKTIELSLLEESKSMQVDHQIRNTTGTEMYQNDVLCRGTGLSIENDLNLDEKYQHEIECHVNSKSVVDVLCGSSIEIMACKVFEQRSDDLQWILLNAWKVRHTCLLQVFRMVLDQYLRSDLINDVQFTNILSTVTKRFSVSLQKLQNSLLQIKHSISENVWEKSGNHSPQQHSSTM
uniref:Uncharacterized protein n=1 Tax=Ciona savignyi TaxID=51511 RepID=H2ZNE3_CIOSA